MITIEWKFVRYTIIVGSFFIIIWLYFWLLPSLGIFHLTTPHAPHGETGIAVVLFENGECVLSYSLNKIEFGWGAVKETWPLILFGIFIGCPVGEFIRWKCAVEELSEKFLKQKHTMLYDTMVRQCKAEGALVEAAKRTKELPALKEEVTQLRRKIFQLRQSAAEQKRSDDTALYKIKSLEKELSNARAKLRRLATQKSVIGKKVEERLQSE